MKLRKRLAVYLFLLMLALATMTILWIYRNNNTVTLRDYPQIEAEGILRIATEYGSSAYYVSDDNSIEGFQYELAQEIARLSGLEVRIH